MTEILDRTTLKALSTDTRQDIIKLLARRPYTASELSKMLNKHVTTVTEHLNVLEKSGLVKKKASTNKWIYYTLSDKGEKLFKPNYYSWVVVLSLSSVFMFTGFLRLFRTETASSVMQEAASKGLAAEALTDIITVPNAVSAIGVIDFIGLGLIALSMIGFGYVGYKIVKIKMSNKL